jgi:hypothetical protein
VLLLLLSAPGYAASYHGRIIERGAQQPIAGAWVTLGNTVVQTGEDGRFAISGEGNQLGVRASGYQRTWIPVDRLTAGGQDVAFDPFTPKTLYLSFYGIANRRLRQSALDLIEATELNGVVIDIKGDRGLIAYPSAIPLAAQVGAQQTITIPDLHGLVTSLRAKGIYTIARIVTFKDNPLALARPDLAVKTRSGSIWRDRERLAWTDPFKQEVQDYNIAVAVEAAKAGFDEIQFDYVRFPDAPGGLLFSMPSTLKSRINAIVKFLQDARQKLTPYNVFLAIDIFGYVCWNLDDTGIGQRLEELMPHLDYLSPMLYPSCFQYGIPGYRNPVERPYETVYYSLKQAQERTHLPTTRFRPWLQAFKDYAYDRRAFTGKEIRTQIQAAEHFGADGWMLWNPRNVYTADGLQEEGDGLRSGRETALPEDPLQGNDQDGDREDAFPRSVCQPSGAVHHDR